MICLHWAIWKRVGINVVHERRLRLAVSSHVSKGGNHSYSFWQGMMGLDTPQRRWCLLVVWISLVSLTRQTYFGGQQVFPRILGQTALYFVVVQLDSCSLKSQKGRPNYYNLGSWGQKQSQSHLGGSEMTTAYRAVRDCVGQRRQLMRSWYQATGWLIS